MPKRFPVILRFSPDDDHDAVLKISLPFAPSVGMKLEIDMNILEVVDVVWWSDGHFACEVTTADDEIYGRLIDDGKSPFRWT